MIRVNLLQVKRKKKPKPLPSFVILGVIFAVVAGLAVALVWMSQGKKINKLTVVKTANQAKIASLKKKVKEVDDFEAKIKAFEQRSEIITGLRKNQSIPVRLMNEISLRLADGVWLKSLKVKESQISLTGYAFTNSNIVEFVNNLKSSPLFSGVYLSQSKESSEGGKAKITVYEFKLEFAIKA